MIAAALAIPGNLMGPTTGRLLATNALWFLSRGAGIITLLILTASVVLGILASLDLGARGLPRFVTPVVHRNVSLLALLFLALHVATTIVDSYVSIRWIDAVIPFIGSYHPLALGLGAICVDLMIAIILTSLFRSHVKPTTWRYVHLSAYACWPIAVLHGMLIGTDRVQGWMLLIDACCALLVGILAIYRMVRRRARVDGRLEVTSHRSRRVELNDLTRASRR